MPYISALSRQVWQRLGFGLVGSTSREKKKETAQGRGQKKGKAVQRLYGFFSFVCVCFFFHAKFDHMKIPLDTQWDCIACLILNVQKLEEIQLGSFKLLLQCF